MNLLTDCIFFSQMYHKNGKSDTWLDQLTDHLNLADARGNKLKTYSEHDQIPQHLIQFNKFVKLAEDTINAITNVMNKIDKNVLAILVSTVQVPGSDLLLEGPGTNSGIRDPRGKRDQIIPKENRMSIEESEQIIIALKGLFLILRFGYNYLQ